MRNQENNSLDINGLNIIRKSFAAMISSRRMEMETAQPEGQEVCQAPKKGMNGASRATSWPALIVRLHHGGIPRGQRRVDRRMRVWFCCFRC